MDNGGTDLTKKGGILAASRVVRNLSNESAKKQKTLHSSPDQDTVLPFARMKRNYERFQMLLILHEDAYRTFAPVRFDTKTLRNIKTIKSVLL